MNQKNYFGTRGNHRKLPEITGVQQRSILPAVSREGGSVAVAAVAVVFYALAVTYSKHDFI